VRDWAADDMEEEECFVSLSMDQLRYTCNLYRRFFPKIFADVAKKEMDP
jgi:hypothetical protein